MISAAFTQKCKTAALSSNDSVTPRFHLIYDLFDTNAPVTEIVNIEKVESNSKYFLKLKKIISRTNGQILSLFVLIRMFFVFCLFVCLFVCLFFFF